MPIGYPPTHRNVDDVQPEVCDLCGLKVGAVHLMETDVEGLRGLYVCDVQPGCRKFRSSLSYSDRRRMDPGPEGVGDSRIYPAGGEPWWTENPLDPLPPSSQSYVVSGYVVPGYVE